VSTRSWLDSLEERVLAGGEVTADEANEMMALDKSGLYELFASANRIARHFKGWEVELCGIINAKSGRCAEDCAFCSQSIHHETDAPVYSLKDSVELARAALSSKEDGADRFGIVTSGTRIKDGEELETICNAVRTIAACEGITPCASLGILPETSLLKLKEAGLTGYHHNLETARSFFPNVCTTHDYEDDVATVRTAKRLGFNTCSGGIFGIGESPAQRVEMALTLRELDIDSVPINFLVPVKGTRLEDRVPLSPLESLRVIAVYRFLLPTKTIRICAGRDRNLGDMASWIFYAGASAMMVGDYLTTAGRTPEIDLEMVRMLGFTPVQGC
jgi:biotin synthase